MDQPVEQQHSFDNQKLPCRGCRSGLQPKHRVRFRVGDKRNGLGNSELLLLQGVLLRLRRPLYLQAQVHHQVPVQASSQEFGTIRSRTLDQADYQAERQLYSQLLQRNRELLQIGLRVPLLQEPHRRSFLGLRVFLLRALHPRE